MSSEGWVCFAAFSSAESLLSDMAKDTAALGCPAISQAWLRLACGFRGCTQRHKQRVSPSKMVSSENPVVVFKQKWLIPAMHRSELGEITHQKNDKAMDKAVSGTTFQLQLKEKTCMTTKIASFVMVWPRKIDSKEREKCNGDKK